MSHTRISRFRFYPNPIINHAWSIDRVQKWVCAWIFVRSGPSGEQVIGSLLTFQDPSQTAFRQGFGSICLGSIRVSLGSGLLTRNRTRIGMENYRVLNGSDSGSVYCVLCTQIWTKTWYRSNIIGFPQTMMDSSYPTGLGTEILET